MFQIARILCPTDFSPGAAAALELAASIADKYDASIDLLAVWSPPVVAAFDAALVPSAEELAAYTESFQRKLDDAIASAPRPHRFLHKHLIQGTPAEEIVLFAERAKSDLIVMGTHGRTGFAHLLLGSVAERVVRTARIPVLTTAMRER
jgi:universal stress protein A